MALNKQAVSQMENDMERWIGIHRPKWDLDWNSY
jgi:hypothetical protein